MQLSTIKGANDAAYRIEPPEGVKTSNLCFGIADGNKIYITESQMSCILTATLPEPGMTLFSHTTATT